MGFEWKSIQKYVFVSISASKAFSILKSQLAIGINLLEGSMKIDTYQTCELLEISSTGFMSIKSILLLKLTKQMIMKKIASKYIFSNM